MNRTDADATLNCLANLAYQAAEEHGAARRATCLMIVKLAAETLAWAGIETQTRRGEREITDPAVR